MGLTVISGSGQEPESQVELTAHDRKFLAEWRNIIREENEVLYEKLKSASNDGDIVNQKDLELALKEQGLQIGHEKIARMVRTPGFPKCQIGKYRALYSVKAVKEWIGKQH